MRFILLTMLTILFVCSSTAASALVINEILYDPPGDANEDGSFDPIGDEFIEFVNETSFNLDLGGYEIWDMDMRRHVFPSGTVIPPDGCLVLFGGGAPAGDFGGARVQVASENAIFGLSLGNAGDLVSVRSAGGLEIASYEYFGSVTDQSETLFPDVTGSEPMVGHTTVGLADYSPGTQVDGTAFAGNGPVTWYYDLDGDGWGDESDSFVSDTQPTDYVSQFGDCDVSDNTVYPGAPELCNGVDNNCNAVIDENCPTIIINEINFDPGTVDANNDGSVHFEQDEFIEFVNASLDSIDLDGFRIYDATGLRHVFTPIILPPNQAIVVFGGGSTTFFSECASQISSGGLYLNNSFETVRLEDPQGTILSEITYGDGVADESLTRYPDITGPDSFVSHTSFSVLECSPGTRIDGSPFYSAPQTTWYRDQDADGWGDETDSVLAETQPAGYVAQSGDCLDTDQTVFPGALELIDGQDNDCDGFLLGGEDDRDGDGFIEGEIDPGGWDGGGIVFGSGDCNDGDSSIFPGAPEICGDGVDRDCDGNPLVPTLERYADADDDGYGQEPAEWFCTEPGPPYIATGGDCDDADSGIYPGAPELIDGKDNDCDGLLLPDEQDQDGDGYIPGTFDVGGWDGDPGVIGDGDCDDSRDFVYPGAPEICGDGVDNNCDTMIDEDCVAYEILAVTDIGNDQGGQVRVRWTAHAADVVDDPDPVLSYSLYRRIDGNKNIDTSDWDFLLNLPAATQPVYNVVAPTLCDSTIAEGACLSVYAVRAHTAAPGVFFDTEPDSGWSVDNLAPSPPGNPLVVAGTLSWDDSFEPDVKFVTIYGSAVGTRDGTELLVGYAVGTEYDVSDDGHPYYLLTATDFSGNESEAAVVSSGLSDVPGVTLARTALLGNHPNPFNPSTVIVYELERSMPVRLRIYDISGRLVRSLVDGTIENVGRNEAAWNGRDETGRLVSTGVYFYRLEAGEYRATSRMTLMK